MYIISFSVAILSGWTLTLIHDPSLRKPLSLTMGCLIQIYMYGKGKCVVLFLSKKYIIFLLQRYS